MKNISIKKLLINSIFILLFAIIIFISLRFIKLDPSIKSLFPFDKKLSLTVDLMQKSPVSDKVIVYIEVDDEDKLEDAVIKVDEIIKNSKIDFKNSIPDNNDVTALIEYLENNSLLLYQYENNKNPFKEEEVARRLNNKSDYLMSIPFFNPSSSFFNDPLMMGLETLGKVYKNSQGKYNPRFGGVVSDDNRSYIKVLKSGFGTEEYGKVKKLNDLDKMINHLAEDNNFTSFLFSSHLYFMDSREKIKREVTVIFIISTIFLLMIFYFFFKNLILLFYSLMPLLGGFAVTFLIISIIKPNFGGIALAFGATTSGIALDYIIHYLTKRNYYHSLNDIRKKIRFSIFLGFVTTIAAFIFLIFSRIESLIEITIFGVLSVTCVFIISWFVFQRLVPPSDITTSIIKIRFPFLKNKKLFIIWLISAIILFAFIPFIRFEDNIIHLDMKHKKLDMRKDIILSKFKESNDSIFLVFDGKNKDEVLRKSFDAYNIIQKIDDDLAFLTPAILTPPKEIINQRKIFIKNHFNKNIFKKEIRNTVFTDESFTPWLNNINNIENLKLTKLPEFFKEQYDSMIVKHNNNYYLMLHIYKREVSNKINEILSRNKIDFYILDIFEATTDKLVNFEKKALFLLSFSLVLIFLIIAIAYKNIIYALTSILPSIFALLACIAVSTFTNNGFNIMHFVSSVLLIGIGVDYGIFMTGAYKEDFNDEEKSLTLQSIFICTLTTISGFGVLTFSSSYSIFSLGSSMFAGILFAFLTAYIALPVILDSYKNKK